MTNMAKLILLAMMLHGLSVFRKMLKRYQYGYVPSTVLIQMCFDFENSQKVGKHKIPNFHICIFCVGLFL